MLFATCCGACGTPLGVKEKTLAIFAPSVLLGPAMLCARATGGSFFNTQGLRQTAADREIRIAGPSKTDGAKMASVFSLTPRGVLFFWNRFLVMVLNRKAVAKFEDLSVHYYPLKMPFYCRQFRSFRVSIWRSYSLLNFGSQKNNSSRNFAKKCPYAQLLYKCLDRTFGKQTDAIFCRHGCQPHNDEENPSLAGLHHQGGNG